MGRSGGGRHYDSETDTASGVTTEGRIKVTLDEDALDFADNVKGIRDSLDDIKILSKKMETHLSIMTDEDIKDEDTNKI